jgi:hypothetical protein
MQTSLVGEEAGGGRRGNAGDASRDRVERVHALDASRFIGVSFVLLGVEVALSSRDTDAQNTA